MNEKVSELENRTMEFQIKDQSGQNIPVIPINGAPIHTTGSIEKMAKPLYFADTDELQTEDIVIFNWHLNSPGGGD